MQRAHDINVIVMEVLQSTTAEQSAGSMNSQTPPMSKLLCLYTI